MTDRVTAFLQAADWHQAARQALAGDASSRRYERLRKPDDQTAVLMIAPPLPDDSTVRFAALAGQLVDHGLSAPRILTGQPDDGLLLLEDLGETMFAQDILADPARETPLYEAAVDLLAALQACPVPDNVPRFGPSTLAEMTAPAADWYAGLGTPQPDLAAGFAAALDPVLAALEGWDTPVLTHRDFHAENLVWLPGRTGPARVGLLDFQDAFAGPLAYDLVSLLEDARRDLAPALRTRLEARFAAATGTPPEALATALAVLGAQRNLRILGVFARLCLHMGKARYVDLIPRVWDHLQGDLAHPALKDVRAATAALPTPTPEFLTQLRARCGTVPTP
ncbi:phosphotransferase [Fluviibacterium sp. DFM31]|uniref:Phosphotransferase n=1 Tax=Meridianimarinicoccus marinus TaxID=3231483 RepID=A0ABV3LBK1_9RHOB